MDWKLSQKQHLPLEAKVILAQRRIREWYDHFDGMVYVAFSGGKDSTVLLDLVRSIYPEVPAVFIDTGLEFPEIREFVKTFDNVVWIKPKMPFNQVIEKYGYPVVSKEQSQFLHELRTTKSEKLRNLRLHGRENGRAKVSEKWKFLIDAPFKISDRCCDVMKKRPAKKYEKESGLHPYIGTMASDSQLRNQKYNKHGCNAFDQKRQTSAPMSVWVETDIWEYIEKNELSYCSIYDRGEDRTGCMFCAFGCEKDEVNRFQRMKKSHPSIHEYCMSKLGLREVLNFMNIRQEMNNDP